MRLLPQMAPPFGLERLVATAIAGHALLPQHPDSCNPRRLPLIAAQRLHGRWARKELRRGGGAGDDAASFFPDGEAELEGWPARAACSIDCRWALRLPACFLASPLLHCHCQAMLWSTRWATASAGAMATGGAPRVPADPAPCSACAANAARRPPASPARWAVRWRGWPLSARYRPPSPLQPPFPRPSRPPAACSVPVYQIGSGFWPDNYGDKARQGLRGLAQPGAAGRPLGGQAVVHAPTALTPGRWALEGSELLSFFGTDSMPQANTMGGGYTCPA